MPNIEDCCGGPVEDDLEACCILDAQVKEAGGGGCGCLERQQARTSDMLGPNPEAAVGAQKDSKCCER